MDVGRDLKRTEKTLCFLASGKWILKTDYIDECGKQVRRGMHFLRNYVHMHKD